jgi:hypothetical protein
VSAAAKRYPCGDPGCEGCQRVPTGARCDHAAGARVAPPDAREWPRPHDRAGTGGPPWSELPVVKRAVGE